jgi:hypothetical protein
MSQRHLSEDRLIEMCLTGAAAPAEESHLVGCGECTRRRALLTQVLDEVNTAADLEVDAAFPADRLARQHARILQRIDQEGRPGRLLSFPAASPPATMLRSRPRARWAAAAVAAAFVVGMIAGHLVHDLPVKGNEGSATPRIVSNERDPAPLRAVSTTWSDEEFLAQVEQAAFRVSPAALGPLDDMTPRSWDVQSR